jgi:cytochrome c553
MAVSGSAYAKGDPDAGRSKSGVCVACHGLTGVSPTDAWPNLAGQGYTYLVNQLKAYRDGTRKEPMMDTVAKRLSDQDIDDLAAYYSVQTAAPAAGSSQTRAASSAAPDVPISLAGDILVPRPHPTRGYWADLMPEGEGRALVVQKCQSCHDSQRTIAFARPKEQWLEVVESMITRGMPATSEEIPIMVNYFTKYFGPDSPPILGPGGKLEVGMRACKPSEWPKGSSDFRSNWKGSYNIWASNQQGGNIDIIDPVTKNIVRRINCVSAPDRAEFSRDGNTAYVPDRVEHNITVIDTRTGAIKAKIPLIARPNVSVLSRDFRKLYAGIWPVTGDADKRGYVQIVDTATLKVVKTIETKGGIHDTWMSRDGKLVLAQSAQGHFLDAYDTRTDELLYTCCTEAEIGTVVMEAGPDGSPSRFFISYSGYPGFIVIDAKTGKELKRVRHPVDTEGLYKGIPHSSGTGKAFGFHGGESSPDGKALWLIQGSFVY